MTPTESKCYRLIQQIVTLRDGICLHCGAVPISAHHLFGRANKGSAFEPDSCLSLCPYCHDHWARTYPQEAHNHLRAKIGDRRYEELACLSRQTPRLREHDYKDIAERLTRELRIAREI